MPEIMCAHIGLKELGELGERGRGLHSIKLDIRQLVPPYMSLRAHLGNLTYHDFRETCQRDHKGNTHLNCCSIYARGLTRTEK